MKWSPKIGFFFVDNDPKGYKLSYSGNFGLGFFSYIQIAFGHSVHCAQSYFSVTLLVKQQVHFFRKGRDLPNQKATLEFGLLIFRI